MTFGQVPNLSFVLFFFFFPSCLLLSSPCLVWAGSSFCCLSGRVAFCSLHPSAWLLFALQPCSPAAASSRAPSPCLFALFFLFVLPDIFQSRDRSSPADKTQPNSSHPHLVPAASKHAPDPAFFGLLLSAQPLRPHRS